MSGVLLLSLIEDYCSNNGIHQFCYSYSVPLLRLFRLMAIQSRSVSKFLQEHHLYCILLFSINALGNDI